MRVLTSLVTSLSFALLTSASAFAAVGAVGKPSATPTPKATKVDTKDTVAVTCVIPQVNAYEKALKLQILQDLENRGFTRTESRVTVRTKKVGKAIRERRKLSEFLGGTTLVGDGQLNYSVVAGPSGTVNLPVATCQVPVEIRIVVLASKPNPGGGRVVIENRRTTRLNFAGLMQ